MDTTVFEKEHKTIVESIDEAYMSSIIGVAEIQSWLQRRNSPSHIAFMNFYKPFLILFKATSKTSALRENQELITKINKWIEKKDITAQRMKDGIDLFDEYQEQLFSTGILNIKR